MSSTPPWPTRCVTAADNSGSRCPVGIGDHEFANDVSADEVAHALHTLRTVAELQAGDIATALEPEYDLVLKA